MSLDIHTAIQTTLIILAILIVMSVWQGISSIRSARRSPFFRLRRNRMIFGWRLLFVAIFMIIAIYLIPTRLEPFIYRYFPPTITLTITPTLTLSPTTSLTPSITLSPTITLTPEVSNTPTITPTPYIPLAIEARFEGEVTPNPSAAFSELIFTQGIDSLYRPVAPGTDFQNPVGHLYALFSYDQMLDDSQWTALWFRNGELVYFETETWNGGSGGYGYTDWNPDPVEWQPGNYEVQIFNGLVWKRSGRFIVVGTPPTAFPSSTAKATLVPSKTLTPTRIRYPSATPIPSRTPRPTSTATLIPSRTPTRTTQPTLAPTPVTPSSTLKPTQTPASTKTRWPTVTASITTTPRPTRTPTQTPSITLTATKYRSPTATLTRTRYPTLTRTPVTPTRTPYPTLTRTPVTPTITPYPTRTRTPTPHPQ